MSSSRDEQKIEFRGICLSEPFKDQVIEGRINLSLADSLRFTQKSNSDHNRSSSKQSYNYGEERGGSNYREERFYQGGKSSRNRGRRGEENGGDRMQLLIVLFGLIFFVNLVAGQLMTNSSSSYEENIAPSYEFNRN